MGGSGDDDAIPAQASFVSGEEIIPSALGIFFGQPFYKLEGAFHHAVRFRDIDSVAKVFAGGGFEGEFSRETGGPRAAVPCQIFRTSR